jgi:transcriptional repressor NrdR
VETHFTNYPHVIKKDGRREPFSKEKLRRGIQIACKKRPVSVSQIENMVALISRWVQASPDKEMAANKIGQAVVKELRNLDDVAFVRFASVYKTFRDVDEFMKSLESETKPPEAGS